MRHRLERYKVGREADQRQRQSGHQGPTGMADNAAVQEMIKQSLEADEDSEDDLDWDTEEASYSAEENIETNGMNSFIYGVHVSAYCDSKP